jgi:hypothetical protein
MSSSVAKEISDQIGSKYVTPAIVQTFLVLSKPVRQTMQTFLDSAEAWVIQQHATALIWSNQGNLVTDKLNVAFGALNDLLYPIDNFIQAIPLDSIAKESSEVTEVLRTITENVPIRLPSSVAVVVTTAAGFDFFDGINSYGDLRDKIDDLEFRLVRATAFSTYVSGTLAYLDNQLDKIRAYRRVITLLND